MLSEDIVDDDEEEKKQPKYPKTLHLSEGYKYFNMCQYKKAISYFDTSLTLFPDNEKTLLGLAKCYFRLGKFDDAKKYVETILKNNRKCADAVYLDATITYLLGDFETSFLTFWRGFFTHFNRKDLRLGYQSCENAINNSLNSDANLFFDDFDVEEVNNLLQEHQQRTGEKFCTKRTEPHSINKDLKFVKSLMEDEMVDIVHSDCKELLDYLNGRQKFWKIHTPNLERRPLKPKIPISVHKDELKKLDSDVLEGMIKNKYSECKEALKDGDIDDSLKLGLEILVILEILASKSFSNYSRFKAEIFQLIGLAYMFKKDFVPALIYFEKQLKIGIASNVLVHQLNPLLFIGEIFFKSNNYEAALDCYEKSMPFTETRHEESFILYKMADCQMHLDPQAAEENALKSFEIAEDLQSSKLQLDAMLLLGEISVKCKDMKKAEELFSKALTIAIECNDRRQNCVQNLVDMFDRKSSSEMILHKISRLSKN